MDKIEPTTQKGSPPELSPPPRIDIAIVGEVNPDMIVYGLPLDIPEERETLAAGFTATLGGSSAILAHNLALLGTRVSFTASIGDDFFGEFCCQRLEAAGVDIRDVRRSGGDTGITIILPHGPRRRILTFQGAMAELTLEGLNLDRISAARHFHVSSPFLQPKLLPHLPDLFQQMRSRGLTTSIDPNDDPKGEWAGFLDQIVPSVDVLFCTEDELTRMAPGESAAQRVADRIPVLVLKRGQNGASVYSDGSSVDMPGLAVDVVDAVGAGDSFDAGFLHMWLLNAPLEICAEFGNLVGALSVTRPGGTEAFRDSTYRESFIRKHRRSHVHTS